MQELDWQEIEHYAPTYWSNLSETILQYGVVDEKHLLLSPLVLISATLSISFVKTGLRK